MLLNIFRNLNNRIQYQLASIRNYYPCRAIGQKTSSPGNTIILYTILGKRDTHEIAIQYLMEDKQLINKFPPQQAAKFGAIALGDLLFSLPTAVRMKKFNEIKTKML